ncbi:hypothetical protein KQ939_00105 [Planococcus sp. CP5-4]|uniref:UDP-3-O-(3-hydroxymyristoyl)glucosamine N-acyltransferase n=1 Tax=unclassified Planococcus (in: firmicutes) TaxID=2662419 RepID=UPI001C22F66D|nr:MULTISPECIES: UDP-3-O-(3-hydroxymyristoyl)glucosamine N-acyltransferase [unclassified Planococcus (in: firmicutes)]MBU9675177.1 hypothetical protein [Planococcus sp. CP5-4_YE]MBV0908042.1 hypothetical protein [Planococcus sp. CP5-4_UN]MBW6062103.1 hypothetical protein [Planococcus sp. CP5-4]
MNIKSIKSLLKNKNIDFAYKGNEQLEIKGYTSVDKVRSNTITWLKNIDKIDVDLIKQVDELLVVSNELNIYEEIKNVNFIFCESPKEVFFTILNEFFNEELQSEFKGSSSVIEATRIGNNVYIGHHCYIGSEVIIKDNVKIKNNVSIEGKVVIGENSVISSGVVIGTDGYGYFQNAEGINIKVPHFGGVIIGKNVEIGANTCIDRGTLNDTIVGDNTKIDNLCHIAHNVIIEENVSIIAQSMIAGSVLLKKNSYVAPSSSILNQIIIGENSLVGLGSVVLKDVEDNVVVAGVPGKIIKKR